MAQDGVRCRASPHSFTELVDHANQLGVHLKSSKMQRPEIFHNLNMCNVNNSFPVLVNTRKGHRPMPPRVRVISKHRPKKPKEFIQNFVVPLQPQTQTEETSTNMLMISSKTHHHDSKYTRRINTPWHVALENRVAINSSNHSFGSHVPAPQINYGDNNRNKMQLALLTRTSALVDDPKDQLQPHRVKRGYYMRGANLELQHKYKVDDNELKQLKEMALSRTHGQRQYRLKSSTEWFSSQTSDFITALPETFVTHLPSDVPPASPECGHWSMEGAYICRSSSSENMQMRPNWVHELEKVNVYSPQFHPKLRLKTRLILPSLQLAKLSRSIATAFPLE